MKNASAFFSLSARKVVEVSLPGLDQKVGVRELSAGQRNELVRLTRDVKDPVEVQCRLIIMAVVSDNGEPMFNDDDVPKLMDMPSRIIDALGTHILEISGMGLEKPEKKD